MNKLMTASINLSKIDKSKIIDGKTGKFIDLVIWFNEEPDSYGNNFSIQQKTGKDEPRIYLGNGKFYIPKEKAETNEGKFQKGGKVTETRESILNAPDESLPF